MSIIERFIRYLYGIDVGLVDRVGGENRILKLEDAVLLAKGWVNMKKRREAECDEMLSRFLNSQKKCWFLMSANSVCSILKEDKGSSVFCVGIESKDCPLRILLQGEDSNE